HHRAAGDGEREGRRRAGGRGRRAPVLSLLSAATLRRRAAPGRGGRDPFATRRAAFEAYLQRALVSRCHAPERLREAIASAAAAPGKRVRPLLTLASCEAVSG